MKDLFFMETLQIRVGEIKAVVILDSYVCDVLNTRYPVRMVINNNHVFTGDEMLSAVKQLHACGYYTFEQYRKVSVKVGKLLKQEALIYDVVKS